MLEDDKHVMCIACDKEHLAVPEEPVLATRYTYVIDMYKGLGPGPICKDHTRDEISTVKEKEFDYSV